MFIGYNVEQKLHLDKFVEMTMFPQKIKEKLGKHSNREKGGGEAMQHEKIAEVYQS